MLAAGLGTRLRPLTLTIPKPLVPVGGVPMLDRVARRLLAAGADRVAVNASHLAEQVVGHVAAAGWTTPDGRAAETWVSVETSGPLETGGGIARAAGFFRRDRPILVHNGDLLTTVPLAALAAAQEASDAWATLAVAPARTDRYLVADDAGLAGWARAGEERLVRSAVGPVRRVDFCGVQALSPALLDRLAAEPRAAFSVMDVYLDLAKAPGRVAVLDGPPDAPFAFLDMGTPDELTRAEAAVRAGDFA